MLKIREMQNVGKARHVVSYYTGKTHTDGSEFYDIALFKSRKAKDRFIAELHRDEGPAPGQGGDEMTCDYCEAIHSMTGVRNCPIHDYDPTSYAPENENFWNRVAELAVTK